MKKCRRRRRKVVFMDGWMDEWMESLKRGGPRLEYSS